MTTAPAVAAERAQPTSKAAKDTKLRLLILLFRLLFYPAEMLNQIQLLPYAAVLVNEFLIIFNELT